MGVRVALLKHRERLMSALTNKAGLDLLPLGSSDLFGKQCKGVALISNNSLVGILAISQMVCFVLQVLVHVVQTRGYIVHDFNSR